MAEGTSVLGQLRCLVTGQRDCARVETEVHVIAARMVRSADAMRDGERRTDGAARHSPAAARGLRGLVLAGCVVLAGIAAFTAPLSTAGATEKPQAAGTGKTNAGHQTDAGTGTGAGTDTGAGTETGADADPEADLSALDPAERKRVRESELAALTDDITLSETRQRELKHQIDTIDRHRDALNADLLRTAQRVHSLEEELSATEARLLRLHENADTVRASLHERRDVLAEVLATLERIGRRPPPALAVRPKDALGAVRSAMLLNAVMPGIHDEAEALAVDLTELTKLETSISGERDRLQSDGSRLAEEKARIELLIQAKRDEADESRRKLAEETARSQELAGKATSLKGLIASLESEIESSRKAAEAAAKADRENAGKARPSDPFADPGRLAPAVAFAETKGKLHLPSPARRFAPSARTTASARPPKGCPSQPETMPASPRPAMAGWSIPDRSAVTANS